MHAASLRETIAAGCLSLAGFSRGKLPEVMCDPMCGSATFAIEAALIARNIAPGLVRDRDAPKIAACTWSDFDAGAWSQAVDDAKQRVDESKQAPCLILANDFHAGAIRLAEGDALRAGVSGDIVFDCADAGVYTPQEKPELVISNPPWDERIQGGVEAWQSMSSFLKRGAAGSTAHLLCGNMPLSRELRMRATSKKKLVSGGVDLRLLGYDVYDDQLVPNFAAAPTAAAPPAPKAAAAAPAFVAAPVAAAAPAKKAAPVAAVVGSYAALTVVQLKDLLRGRDLKLSGVKQELIDRLRYHDEEAFLLGA
jgi:23S rRNA G2445 N2-methylase RlmL